MIATRKASQDVIQWAAGQVPGDGRRLRRPRAFDPDADQGRRQRGARQLRRPQPALRHPRARHGGDRQRPHAARPARVRRRLLHLQRLHEGVAAAGRDHADPVDLRLHARLDRRGRGRPDAPADRAARRAARHAQPQRRAARGLQRDRAGLALRAVRHRDADGARALPPGRPDLGPGGRARRRDRARRLRARGRRRRRAGPDPDGLGHGGPHRQRRAASCSRRRASRCGW